MGRHKRCKHLPCNLPSLQPDCAAYDANYKCKAPNNWDVCSKGCPASTFCNDDTLGGSSTGDTARAATGYCTVRAWCQCYTAVPFICNRPVLGVLLLLLQPCPKCL